MKELNKAAVETLFRQEAVLMGSEDRVPLHRAEALFGRDATKHVKSLNASSPGRYLNGYGVGDYTMDALTYRGFQAAASFYNVQLMRREEEQ